MPTDCCISFIASSGSSVLAARRTTLIHGVSRRAGTVCQRDSLVDVWGERHNRMMAGFLADHSLLARDNVRTGTIISCQELGLVLTSLTYNDRILGDHRHSGHRSQSGTHRTTQVITKIGHYGAQSPGDD